MARSRKEEVMKFAKRRLHQGLIGAAGLLFIGSLSLNAFASAGGSSGGGGDIQCDALIKDLANNLKSWIRDGGPEAGKLNLSSSFNPETDRPYTIQEYNSDMTRLLSLPLDVSCVGPGDKGYPVMVDGSKKICATWVDRGGVHMTCDRSLFLGLNTDQQIEQDHHEFAINVPGLEPDTGPISTYKISTQLSASITDVTVRRLVVTSSDSTGPLPGMKFVSIPAGTFMMGSPQSETGRYNSETQHSVTLTHGFQMQATDVTQAQWVAVMGSNPSDFQGAQYCKDTFKQVNGVSMCPNHPVEQVSWDDAQVFITKLNQKQDGYLYRLPTEAEWEYAPRAGTTTAYFFGNGTTEINGYAWYSSNSEGQTHEVAKLRPNAWGLYDMAGNVWQWVQDWYGVYSRSCQENPEGPAGGSGRVIRGGSWSDGTQGLRSAFRTYEVPGSRNRALGFRLVRTR
jgi:formylglycine-generating enzyme required for sulfatase activity